jgi:YHS domain-containing protein
MSKATLTRGTKKRSIACTAILVALLLNGCGTPYATVRNQAGEDVMLLGHDPVAYFKLGKSVRGDPAIKASLPSRTYFFMNEENRKTFLVAPGRYEPQYGGFCSSGAAFAIKLGSDPSEWEIVHGKLYMFGDVLGHEAWRLDPRWNIEHGDQVWPEAREAGWRWQSLKRYMSKVSWYKSQKDIAREFRTKYPDGEWPKYDVGSMVQNLFTKYPGWRAREGFGPQPVIGLVGDDPCPPACPGTESKPFAGKRQGAVIGVSTLP